MARTPRKTIGLAIQGNRILAAEMRLSGPRRVLSRAAEFVFPAGEGLGDPVTLGKSLGQFLREQKFTARYAVIGLPAQWLMTRQHLTPPADESALASLLRIQAERAFSHDGRDLAMDYVLQGSEGGQQSVLLFAAMQQKVDQVRELAEAAGLGVLGVTPSATALALASAPDTDTGTDLTVQVVPGSVELTIRDAAGRFRTVRHLPVSIDPENAREGGSHSIWLETLASEVRRVLATSVNDRGSADNGRLVVWDGVGLEPDAGEQMGKRLSVERSEQGGLAALAELNGALPEEPEACQYAAAVALARAAVETDLVAVDFVHSRLAPPQRSRFDWRWRVGTIAAASLLLVVGLVTFNWYDASSDVRSLQQQISVQAVDVEEAAALIAKVESASPWFEEIPQSLECLLELSRLIPADGRIWATSVSLPDDMRGILSGKATDDDPVLDVIRRLQNSPAFSDVKLNGGIKYPTARSRDPNLSFSIGFRFNPVK